MHNANNQGIALWTHRVLTAIAQTVSDDCTAGVVAQLAHTLARAPCWEGCPTAADTVFGDTGNRYRRLALRDPLTADDYSVLLIAWPSRHVTPIHDHDGLWGVELLLDGALQVESFAMTATPALQLTPRDVTLLGVGDHTTFSEQNYAHRCRNLSTQRPALSLHVYGGALERYRAYDQDSGERWGSTPQRTELELANY